jgi:hypothetical protein
LQSLGNGKHSVVVVVVVVVVATPRTFVEQTGSKSVRKDRKEEEERR